MNITKFDSVNAGEIHREMLTAVQSVAQKYGIKIRQGGGQFDLNKCTLRFDLTADSDDAQKIAFATACGQYGCKPEDFGRRAIINGLEVELIGFNRSRPKFCVLCKSVKEGRNICYADTVLAKYFHTGFPVEPVRVATVKNWN